MNVIGIIPARYNSSRFPGKPLAMIGDKSMIQRVYERARLSGIKRVVVATDDKRIVEHSKKIGAEVVLTSKKHLTGTDRCAEAYKKLGEKYDIVVNIQGDEPFIDPQHIKLLAHSFTDKSTSLATLVEQFESYDELHSSSTVKVVSDVNDHAIYFSRAIIPLVRDYKQIDWLKNYEYFKHIGAYAYRAETLTELVKLKQCNLEKAESLEQLRWIFYGYKIKVVKVKYHGISVDTPEDLEKANEILNNIYT